MSPVLSPQLPADFVPSQGPKVVRASTKLYWSTIPLSDDDKQDPEPPAKRLRATKAWADYAMRYGSELPSSHLPSPDGTHSNARSSPSSSSVIRGLTELVKSQGSPTPKTGSKSRTTKDTKSASQPSDHGKTPSPKRSRPQNKISPRVSATPFMDKIEEIFQRTPLIATQFGVPLAGAVEAQASFASMSKEINSPVQELSVADAGNSPIPSQASSATVKSPAPPSVMPTRNYIDAPTQVSLALADAANSPMNSQYGHTLAKPSMPSPGTTNSRQHGEAFHKYSVSAVPPEPRSTPESTSTRAHKGSPIIPLSDQIEATFKEAFAPIVAAPYQSFDTRYASNTHLAAHKDEAARREEFLQGIKGDIFRIISESLPQARNSITATSSSLPANSSSPLSTKPSSPPEIKPPSPRAKPSPIPQKQIHFPSLVAEMSVPLSELRIRSFEAPPGASQEKQIVRYSSVGEVVSRAEQLSQETENELRELWLEYGRLELQAKEAYENMSNDSASKESKREEKVMTKTRNSIKTAIEEAEEQIALLGEEFQAKIKELDKEHRKAIMPSLHVFYQGILEP